MNNEKIVELITTYQRVKEVEIMTPELFGKLSKERRKVYEGLSGKVDDKLVVGESKFFIAIGVGLMSMNNLSKDEFSVVLSDISNVGDKIKTKLDAKIYEEILKSEKEMLELTLREYKKTPNRYGFKIKLLKKQIKSLEQKSEAESEN